MSENTVGYGWVAIREEWYSFDEENRYRQELIVCGTEELAKKKVEEYTRKDIFEPISNNHRLRYFYQQLPIISESPRKM